MTSRYALQDRYSVPKVLGVHGLPPTTFHLQPITQSLPPTTFNYHLQPTTGRVGPVSGIIFLQFKFFESDRPSSSPFEFPGTMLSMKFCIEWRRVQGL